MASIASFHYQEKKSPLHSLGVIPKLMAIFLLTLYLFPSNLFKEILISFVLILAFYCGKVSIKELIQPLIPFIVIMGGVLFISNTLYLSLWGAGIKTLRFILIILSSLLFTATTPPLSIGKELYYHLKKIPFLPSKQISLILSLSLTLLPLLLDEIEAIKEAMSSRLGLNKKKPIKTLFRLGIPLFEGILLRAEELTESLDSRSFSQEATIYQDSKLKTPIWYFILLGIITLMFNIPLLIDLPPLLSKEF